MSKRPCERQRSDPTCEPFHKIVYHDFHWQNYFCPSPSRRTRQWRRYLSIWDGAAIQICPSWFRRQKSLWLEAACTNSISWSIPFDRSSQGWATVLDTHWYPGCSPSIPENQIKFSWHLKHPRKNGATLSCPFAATMWCPFQIKYKIKGTQLTILTRSDHDHTTEIRQRGLPVAQASVVQEMATAMPTGFNCLIEYFYSIIDISFWIAVVKPHQLHIEINAASKIHISQTKKNVCSLRHMVKRERVKNAIFEVYGKPIPSTYEAFAGSSHKKFNAWTQHWGCIQISQPWSDDLLWIARWS